MQAPTYLLLNKILNDPQMVAKLANDPFVTSVYDLDKPIYDPISAKLIGYEEKIGSKFKLPYKSKEIDINAMYATLISDPRYAVRAIDESYLTNAINEVMKEYEQNLKIYREQIILQYKEAYAFCRSQINSYIHSWLDCGEQQLNYGLDRLGLDYEKNKVMEDFKEGIRLTKVEKEIHVIIEDINKKQDLLMEKYERDLVQYEKDLEEYKKQPKPGLEVKNPQVVLVANKLLRNITIKPNSNWMIYDNNLSIKNYVATKNELVPLRESSITISDKRGMQYAKKVCVNSIGLVKTIKATEDCSF